MEQLSQHLPQLGIGERAGIFYGCSRPIKKKNQERTQEWIELMNEDVEFKRNKIKATTRR